MSVTIRLVTLEPPGAALNGVLDALHTARRAGAATTVGRADRMPKIPGQPDGAYTVVELVTEASAEAMDATVAEFIDTARQALTGCGISYAWCWAGGSWRRGT